MTFKKLLLVAFIFLCQCVCAQQDSIIVLDEVVIADNTLKKFSKSQSIISISDSVLTKNQPSLTDLLKFNTPIYFKENGYGMVSSPSFRGTTAQQTAVIWNGININSQFNGQTDFNTISSKSYSQIDVKSGGGSVIYGTSAIGGSIHLNNNLSFNKPFTTDFTYTIGSYNSHQATYKLSASNQKWSVNSTIDRNSSDNDFEYPNGLKNTNGEYANFAISTAVAYKVNSFNTIKLYNQFSQSDRNFALLSPSDSKTKYYNEDSRNLLEWQFSRSNIISNLKAAFISEEYKYFENITSEDFSGSQAKTIIGKYDLEYNFGKSQLKAILEYNNASGSGKDIRKNTRSSASAAVLFTHQPMKSWFYELGLRQEISSTYDSPILFSAGSKYKVNDLISLKLNGSRNFRIPTFNDMYWKDGGNVDLKPETSYQAEIGPEVSYKNSRLSVTGYYIDIKDMIQWLPGQTTIWYPKNIQQVTSKGIEIAGSSSYFIGTNIFKFAATYANTISENKAGKQLIYVPKHKATASLAYSKSKFSTYLQFLYNGEVFTRTDNNPKYIVDSYEVANFGAGYDFGTVKTGFNVLNIFDKDYVAMDRRPFPGRNFTIYLNLNF